MYAVGALSVAALLAAACFLTIITQRPGRTPILTLSLTYPVERWPANVWVDENTTLVSELEGDAFHVRRVDLVADQPSQPVHPIEALQNAIRSIDVAMPSDQPLLVYLNAHMAINDRDELCLIGADSDPQQSETWHSVETFVRRYFEGEVVESGRPLIFMLESNCLQRWLPAGLLHNKITTRLSDLATQYAHTNSSRRVGWLLVENEARTIADLSRDPIPFTRFLCETLAAQRPVQVSSDSTSEASSPVMELIANGAWIDSRGLQSGLQARLDQWSRDRGMDEAPQVRWFDTGGSEPLRLALAGATAERSGGDMQGARSTNRLIATNVSLTNSKRQTFGDSDSFAENMKRDFDSFQGTDIARRQPLPWIRLHTDAERLVSARSAGQGLAAQLPALEQRWSRDLRRLQQIAFDQKSSTDTADRTDPVRVTLEEIAARAVRLADAWNAVAQNPRRETVEQLVTQAEIDECEPCPMMVAMLAEPTSDRWNRTDLVARLAAAQAAALRIESEIPMETFGSVRVWVDQLDRARRQTSDVALAACQPDDALFEVATEAFGSAVKGLGARIRLWSQTWHTAQRANIAVPFFWTFLMDHPEPWSNASAVSQFLDDWQAIRQCIAVAPTHDTLVDASEFQKWQQRIERTHSFLDRVETQWREQRLTTFSGTFATKKTLRRSPSEVEQLSHPFGAVSFQIATATWSAWRVRQQLRGDATATLNLDHGAIPRWSRTVSMQSDDLAERWLRAFVDHHRRHRVCDEVERVMDDFWRGPRDEPDALFDRLATSMLASLSKSATEETTLLDRQQTLQERLERCREFIADGTIRPIARLDGVQVAGTPVQAEVHVESDHVLPADVKGVALIQIRQTEAISDGQDVGASVLGKGIVSWNPLPNRDRPMRLAVRSDAAAPDQSLATVLSYRGHEFVGPVSGVAHARFVRRNPVSAPVTAQISLEPSPVRRRAVVFVVDASASMNADAPAEQTRRESDPSSKLDAARAAVLAATDRLWQRQCDLGMVIYGHRVAIDAKRGSTLIQKRYATQFPFPFSIPAYRDVEVALPVGRFGSQQYADMENRLTNLVPWGQSPLHLAIDAAIDDLIRSGPHQSRDIVVITDGRNYQFNPTPDAVLPIEAIVKRARAESIRVHVVGFANHANESGRTSAAPNPSLSPIARATGGWQAAGVHDFVNGLLHGADSSPLQFQLSRRNSFGEAVGPMRTIEVGQTLTLDTTGSINEPWQLSLPEQPDHGRTQAILLSPGDHVRLRVNGDGILDETALPLVRQPEPQPPIIWLPLHRHRRTLPLQVGLWQTRLQEQTATFRFGIQSTAELTTARPERIWIEAAALEHGPSSRSRSATPVKYASSSVRWLPGYGLPMAEFSCQQWPTDSDEFDLQVWAGTPSPAQRRVLQLPDGDHQRWTADTFPGHRFELRRRDEEITLTIHYPEPSTGKTNDAMWIVGTDETAQRQLSAEWYDPQGRVSVHEFAPSSNLNAAGEIDQTLTLSAASDSDEASNCLHLVSIADFKRDAATLAKPHHGVVTSITTSVGSAASRVKQR